MTEYRIYSWCDEHGELEEFTNDSKTAHKEIEEERRVHGKCQGFYIELYGATETMLGMWNK